MHQSYILINALCAAFFCGSGRRSTKCPITIGPID